MLAVAGGLERLRTEPRVWPRTEDGRRWIEGGDARHGLGGTPQKPVPRRRLAIPSWPNAAVENHETKIVCVDVDDNKGSYRYLP